MSLRRDALRLASTLQGEQRRSLLAAITASDREAKNTNCDKLLPALRQNCLDAAKGGGVAGGGGPGKDKGKGKKDDEKFVEPDKGGKGGKGGKGKSKKKAKDWIQDAVKDPGRLHRYFGVPEDENIPMAKLKAEAEKLKGKKDKTDDEKSLQRAIQMAITMKGHPQWAAKGGKKASVRTARTILASFQGEDAMLARGIMHLASRMPQHRSVLLDTLKQAAGEEDGSVPNEGFDPTEIGEVEPGGGEELDSDETYMKDEFTQQEFHELGDLQEANKLPEGQDDPQKYASDKRLRRGLIRLASTMPKGSRDRQDLLFLLSGE